MGPPSGGTSKRQSLSFALSCAIVVAAFWGRGGSLGRLTFYSLKATSLSWAAKAGMDLESRLLGYHFHPHLKSVL
eukprot:720390-Amphidinium_carterae.2